MNPYMFCVIVAAGRIERHSGRILSSATSRLMQKPVNRTDKKERFQNHNAERRYYRRSALVFYLRTDTVSEKQKLVMAMVIGLAAGVTGRTLGWIHVKR